MALIPFLTVILFSFSSCSLECRRERDGKMILYYAAGNNNLSYDLSGDIQEMSRGDIPGKNDVNVLLVYEDIAGEKPSLKRVYKDSHGEPVFETIEVYERQNSASPDVMRNVLTRSVQLFKSRRYGLILSSHATGWLPQGYYTRSGVRSAAGLAGADFTDPFADIVKSFGSDASDAREINIDELATILPVYYDFILFDCCLMGGIEVLCELKDCAEYVIASPTEILSQGFPYESMMGELFREHPDYVKVCDMFFSLYKDQNYPYNSATIALYSTVDVNALASSLHGIIDERREFMENIDMADMQPYFRNGKHWFYDLGHYVRSFATEEQYKEFSSILDKVVLYHEATPSFLGVEIDPEKYHGISTYIRKNGTPELDEYYKKLKWNVLTGMIK